MIIGFGSIEVATAQSIIEECHEAMTEDGIQGVEKIKAKYAADEERYKVMGRDEAPERYTYFWFSYCEKYEGRYFIEFTMHHVNRRHPFSPDGWALLITKWILGVDPNDGKTIYRAV